MERACPYCNFVISTKFGRGGGNEKKVDEDAGSICTNCGAVLEEPDEEEEASAANSAMFSAVNEPFLQNDDADLPGPLVLIPSTSDDSLNEDPEFLELQEREQIVDKYERGPDHKDVDPWENPNFELYRVTDRYGFVHKQDDLSADQAEQKRIQKELRREAKWVSMYREWAQRHPSKLPERIWKGVPDKMRLVIWMRLLGVAEMKAHARPKLYQELLMRARLVSKDIKQIDLDINRTYRDHLAFRKRYDVKQQSLFNLLTAYSMLNTEVGYCQGMSQIAAVFLMYMDEEDAFWSTHALLVNRKYTMHGFFVPGFPKLHRFQNHYDKVLLKYLPRVRKHLEQTGIPPIYLTKWWFGCFLDRVPFSLTLRLWDVFLYYGDCILIAMAYNIMKMHKKTLVKLGIEEFMEFIQRSLAENFGFPDDKVMESLEECLRKLQNDRMALPPPPNPRDPSEVPTKTLAPILTRSMLDIRSDIAEVYSRCSRANSLAGRSPAPNRRQQTKPHNKSAAISARIAALNNCSATTAGQLDGVEGGGGGAALDGKEEYAASCTTPGTSSVATASSSFVAPPVEPFLRRVGSTKDRRHRPPPVPDEDGFVRMSPRQRRDAGRQQKQQPPQQQRHFEENAAASSIHKRQPSSHYDNVSSDTCSSSAASATNGNGASSNSNKNNTNNTNNNNVQNAKMLPESKLPRKVTTSSEQQQQQRSSSSSNQKEKKARSGSLKNAAQTSQQQQQLLPSLYKNGVDNNVEHRREISTESGHRVHRTQNNVTYLTLGIDEEEQQQQKNASSFSSPPPSSNSTIKNLINNSSGDQRGGGGGGVRQQQISSSSVVAAVDVDASAGAASSSSRSFLLASNRRTTTTNHSPQLPVPLYFPPPDYPGSEQFNVSSDAASPAAAISPKNDGSGMPITETPRRKLTPAERVPSRIPLADDGSGPERRRRPSSQKERPPQMVRPLYARDEKTTKVIRRF